MTHWPVLATDDLLYREYCTYKKEEADAKLEEREFVLDPLFESLTGEDFVHEVHNMGEVLDVKRVKVFIKIT